MFALVNVYNEFDNCNISGSHINYCCACTLEEAIQRAKDTEKINSNKIKVAVVDVPYSIGRDIYTYVERVDTEK